MQKSSVVSYGIYNKVLAGLLILTFIALFQPSILPLALSGTLVIQVFIAVLKAFLITMYFMHLRTETFYLKSFVVMALTILVVFFLIVGIDTYYRYGY